MKNDLVAIVGPSDSLLALHLEARAVAAGMQVNRVDSVDRSGSLLGAADVVIDATVGAWAWAGTSQVSGAGAIAGGRAGTEAEAGAWQAESGGPAAIESAMQPDALLCVCCHATSATRAASALTRPQRVVGFGLLPPCEERETVELAQAIQTDDAAVAAAIEFWRRLGHEPILVGDGAGLVVARVVACLANEAAFAAMEGVATAHDIDVAMRLGTGYPRGPLAWCDLVGASDILATLDALAAEHGDDRYRAAPLLRRMAAAGAKWEGNDDRQ